VRNHSVARMDLGKGLGGRPASYKAKPVGQLKVELLMLLCLILLFIDLQPLRVC
jgi:hypothetical protein